MRELAADWPRPAPDHSDRNFALRAVSTAAALGLNVSQQSYWAVFSGPRVSLIPPGLAVLLAEQADPTLAWVQAVVARLSRSDGPFAVSRELARVTGSSPWRLIGVSRAADWCPSFDPSLRAEVCDEVDRRSGRRPSAEEYRAGLAQGMALHAVLSGVWPSTGGRADG